MSSSNPYASVYIVDDPSMNTFATDQSSNAAVAATTSLGCDEPWGVEGVIGHEVNHIRNYDIRISTIAVALASAITMLSSIGGRMMWWGGGGRRDDREGGSGLGDYYSDPFLLAIVLAPLAATLVQLAISRQQGVLGCFQCQLTRNPQGMINALWLDNGVLPMQREVDSASSALLSTILKRIRFAKTLYTHPPIAERASRLERCKKIRKRWIQIERFHNHLRTFP